MENLDGIGIKQKIHDLILEILQKIAHDDLIEERNLLIFNLDSLNVIRLIFKLQDSFEVAFNVQEINFNNFSSIAKIADLIASKKGIQGSPVLKVIS